MSSRPRTPEGDDLVDEGLVEPDWVERLRLAREQHTKEWGQRFVGRRPGSASNASSPAPATQRAETFEMPERRAQASADGFFDQDALATPSPGAESERAARTPDDAFYDQDEEPWV